MRPSLSPRSAASIPSPQTPPVGGAEDGELTPVQENIRNQFLSELNEVHGDVFRLARCFEKAAEFDDRGHPTFHKMVRALMHAVERMARKALDQGHLNEMQQLIENHIECFNPRAGTAHLSMLMDPRILPSAVNFLLRGPGQFLAFNVLSAAQQSDPWRDTPALSELTQLAVHQLVHAAAQQDGLLVSEESYASAPPELRGLLVHACLEYLEATPLRDIPRFHLLARGLNTMLAVPMPDDHEASVTQHLGHLLATVARRAIGTLSDASDKARDEWRYLERLFANPRIPVAHKTEVAWQIAKACLGAPESQHFSGGACSAYRMALIASTFYLPDTHKISVAQALFATDNPHELAALAKLVRSIGDAQIADRMRAELHPRLLAMAPNLDYDVGDKDEELEAFVEFFWETMHIEQGENPELLDVLSQSFTDAVVTPEISDRIAVLTFQADPNGDQFVPGTEIRDEGDVVGGTKFEYPQWLVDRRTILQKATQSWEAPVMKLEKANMLAPLAAITAQYDGRRVQPSDWPLLLEVLKANPVDD